MILCPTAEQRSPLRMKETIEAIAHHAGQMRVGEFHTPLRIFLWISVSIFSRCFPPLMQLILSYLKRTLFRKSDGRAGYSNLLLILSCMGYHCILIIFEHRFNNPRLKIYSTWKNSIIKSYKNARTAFFWSVSWIFNTSYLPLALKCKRFFFENEWKGSLG